MILSSEKSEIVNVLESAALKEANAIVEEIIGSPSNLQNSHVTPISAKSGKYITFFTKGSG